MFILLSTKNIQYKTAKLQSLVKFIYIESHFYAWDSKLLEWLVNISDNINNNINNNILIIILSLSQVAVGWKLQFMFKIAQKSKNFIKMFYHWFQFVIFFY